MRKTRPEPTPTDPERADYMREYMRGYRRGRKPAPAAPKTAPKADPATPSTSEVIAKLTQRQRDVILRRITKP